MEQTIRQRHLKRGAAVLTALGVSLCLVAFFTGMPHWSGLVDTGFAVFIAGVVILTVIDHQNN